MAYDSKKSPKAIEPRVDPKSDFRSDNAAASRQEDFTGTGERKLDPGVDNANGTRYTDTDRDAGTLVKMGPNTKHTDTLKNPLNAYQRRVFAPVVNPDPVADRSKYSTKAPGRTSDETLGPGSTRD